MSTDVEKDWQLAQIFPPSLLRFVHYFVHFSYPARGNSLRLACARHLPLRKEAWVWHLAAREMGRGHGFGVTSRGRGNSLRLAETRLVLDINLVIFFEKCAKNRKKCEILARRGTSWHVFSGEVRPPLFFSL